MNEWVWFSIAVFLLFLVVYPYMIYPLVLRLLPTNESLVVGAPTNNQSSAALLFCAYNEESSLPKKIENIKHLKKCFPQMKVYAYSDASTDATNDILINASSLLEPIISKKRLGKIAGMKKLVSMADADILIFTDANVLLEADGLMNLLRYFNNPEIGCVSGTLLYQGIDSTTAKVGGLYWRLENHIKNLESSTGSTVGADGAIFARRRSNYPDIPLHLVDDMAVSMQVIFEGKRCIKAPDVIAYENAVTSSTEEFSRKKRIACGSYTTYLYQRKKIRQMSLLNRFKFFSHKLLRWWGAYLLISTIISFLMWGVSIGQGLIFLLTCGLLILAVILLGRAELPGISTLYEILAAIFATGLGVSEALVGKKYATWNTAQTR